MASSHKQDKHVMTYTGFRLKSDTQIEKIDLKAVTPQQFFDRYISKRKPVVLKGFVPGFNPSDWTLEELKRRAGHLSVKVEQKGPLGGFGTALPREKMDFSDFIDKMQSKDQGENYYLTTQYEDEDDEDLAMRLDHQMLHEYLPPPLPGMLTCFPNRPAILGNLMPQQANVWIGRSENGTSSGLHHDFHDNLYLLIFGRKRFTLFSPADALNLYTHGTISKVHPNGLINYKNRDSSRSDGATELELAQHRVDILEARLDQMKENQIGGPEREVLEQELAAAEEIAFQLLGSDGHDDFDDLMGGDGNLQFDDDFDDNTDGDSEEDEMTRKTRKLIFPEDYSSDEEDIVQPLKEEPNSFSKISVQELHKVTPQVLAKFKLLKKAIRATVELKSGEMLYLPAGWFHEVTSYNESGPTASKAHIAFNYWMHPPATEIATYAEPYEDNYWASKWQEMEELISDLKEEIRTGKRRYTESDEDEEEVREPPAKRVKNK